MKNYRGILVDMKKKEKENNTTMTRVYIAYLLEGFDIMLAQTDKVFDDAVEFANDLYISNDGAGINCAVDYIVEVIECGMDLDVQSDAIYNDFEEYIETYGW